MTLHMSAFDFFVCVVLDLFLCLLACVLYMCVFLSSCRVCMCIQIVPIHNLSVWVTLWGSENMFVCVKVYLCCPG